MNKHFKPGLLFLISVLMSNSASADAVSFCDSDSGRNNVCTRMEHLRAQIYALDSQRELMQINPAFMQAMGNSIASNASAVLDLLGTANTEHQLGLIKVAQLGEKLAEQAAKQDGEMVVTANQIRGQCATCHAQEKPPGSVKWDELFKQDWTYISTQCSQTGRNPYLCKSMNGMLSSYGFLLTARDAELEDYAMFEQAALEISRILLDLKAKNFSHLPEVLRSKAEFDARELAVLSSTRNPLALEKIKSVANSCTDCHMGRVDQNHKQTTHNTWSQWSQSATPFARTAK